MVCVAIANGDRVASLGSSIHFSLSGLGTEYLILPGLPVRRRDESLDLDGPVDVVK